MTDAGGGDFLDRTLSLPGGDATAFLAAVRPFAGLDADVLGLLRSRMSERRYAAGDVLMRQGDVGEFLALIEEGEVEVAVDEGGRSHQLERVGRGGVLGEMALLTGQPRTATVSAVGAVRAFLLEASAFHALAAQHPRIGVVLTLLLASRLGTARHDALTGKTFAGYRILGGLGRGGMSVVYAAEGPDGNRVALKMMSHALLYDPRAHARFHREAEILGSLDHPNIARVYGQFEALRTLFLVMEHCEGTSLESALAERGPLPEPVVRAILGQLASGLSHAHAAGIVHRDVKPSNVMVTDAGLVKLMDFGLAGRLEDGHPPGSLVGTPRYMAPEQLRGDAATPASDLFALGQVVWELLTGTPLYWADTLPGLRRSLQRRHVPERAAAGRFSPEMAAVLAGLLTRRAAGRQLPEALLRTWVVPVRW